MNSTDTCEPVGAPAEALSGVTRPSIGARVEPDGGVGGVSILFPPGYRDGPGRLATAAPACLHDLALDQVIDAVWGARDDRGLRRVWWTPLRDREAIRFRQAVFRDLEDPELRAGLVSFAAAMDAVRTARGVTCTYDNACQRDWWLLEAAGQYVGAVLELAKLLQGMVLGSAALKAVREAVAVYVGSDAFHRLQAGVEQVRAALAGVRYAVRIHEGSVQVRRCDGEPELTPTVEALFARFRHAAPRDYHVAMSEPSMNHIEAMIVERVARLHPEPFRLLRDFAVAHAGFSAPLLEEFDRELAFYLTWCAHVDWLARPGLYFCLPEVDGDDGSTVLHASFDLALAAHALRSGVSVVANDLVLGGEERLVVVTGPNQGGKTTFARMVGQVHYLACLGVSVPGARVRLRPPDRVLTLFEQAEQVENLRGRLADELQRLRIVLERATGESLVILNEVFASTSVVDARALSLRVLARLRRLGARCVCVTFMDELARGDAGTVSMVATVDAADPARRMFRLERRAPEGQAYARALARRYGLTREQLLRRLRP